MRIEAYSIVKLHKNKYAEEGLKGCNEEMPRLLVIRSFTDSAQCNVRYHNGYIQRVEYQDITNKSVFTKEHKDYPKLIRELNASYIEFGKPSSFKPFLMSNFPQLAIELEQAVDARNRRYEETHPKAVLTAPIVIPDEVSKDVATPQDRQLALLESIDRRLALLVDLWGGRQ